MGDRIVVAGGTGFLGRALADAFLRAGREVVILTRRPAAGDSSATNGRGGTGGIRLARWTPENVTAGWATLVDGAAAVVNLAGESIGDGRWTEARKQRLRDSRLAATHALAAAIRASRTPPRVFVSASAVGYYGLRGDETLTEESRAGDDFLARLCVDWEAAALKIGDVTRVVLTRTGLVLDGREGALPRMLAPFRFFVGGPIASGRQYISWVHLRDWVALVEWAIDETRAAGPLNVTAERPVTNAQFASVAGTVLHRPALVPVPAFAIRLLVGEMGEALVLGGQRAIPRRAMELGFEFRYTDLEAALRDVLAGTNG